MWSSANMTIFPTRMLNQQTDSTLFTFFGLLSSSLSPCLLQCFCHYTKCCDKHSDKDEDNTSSQKYRQTDFNIDCFLVNEILTQFCDILGHVKKSFQCFFFFWWVLLRWLVIWLIVFYSILTLVDSLMLNSVYTHIY